mgnify:CR=1 FL=1
MQRLKPLFLTRVCNDEEYNQDNSTKDVSEHFRIERSDLSFCKEAGNGTCEDKCHRNRSDELDACFVESIKRGTLLAAYVDFFKDRSNF